MVPEDSRPARAAHLGQLGSNRGNSREESTRNLLSYKTMMKHLCIEQEMSQKKERNLWQHLHSRKYLAQNAFDIAWSRDENLVFFSQYIFDWMNNNLTKKVGISTRIWTWNLSTPGLSGFWDQSQANSALYCAFWSVEQTDFKNVIVENIHWALFEDAEVAEVKRPRNQKRRKFY